MKTKRILIALMAIPFLFVHSCRDEFLDKDPRGTLNFAVLNDEAGINGLLIGAYSALDGWIGWGAGQPWQMAASNWVYGDVTADDAHRGSDAGDQPLITPIERFEAIADNDYFDGKWRAVYDGIARSNDVLRAIETSDLPQAQLDQFAAEARFLRAHYHFEAKKMWNMVPFIDETITDFRVPNDVDIWPDIEADLEFARGLLPQTQTQVGRATWGAATALLAKAHMFQNDFAAAKPLLDAVISSGLYDLFDNYHKNFNADYDNGIESIFQVQNSANDGTPESDAGNWGDMLNAPHGASPFGCCGFHQPSQNLVNAHQTDAVTGLPLLDTFNDTDVTNDQGLASTEAFVEHPGPLDPRLDWSVGRRGIPYLGWGDHPGRDWIRDQAFSGPYSPKKNLYTASQAGSISTTSGWAQTPNANNTNLIRYADVLLWRAEVAVEENDLETARTLVNQIRARAADSFVFEDDGVTPAANYVIGEYLPLVAPFDNQANARKAVRFERRLELAMEGHRFFDLVRWGIAESTLNTYLAVEETKRAFLTGARFTSGVNEYFPIPQEQIDLSAVAGENTLTQNPGY